MPSDPTVFVVDDDQAVRDSLRWLIESVDLAVAAYPDAQSFLAEYDPARPGCLVLDVRMPGMSGLDLQDALAEHAIKLPVIVITGHADVPMAVRAMKGGAFDFIEKPFSDQVLLERVQDAIAQDAAARREAEALADIDARLASLTPREREVLERVVDGQSNKIMARELGLSTKTIEVHRANVKDKMGAESVSGLVKMVLRWKAAAGGV